ncbi:MAG TPA: c-type cytochrome [Bryobacteraceae bacterium]|nr:c-type cytochrome [Bryobacteraceae bacterium]
MKRTVLQALGTALAYFAAAIVCGAQAPDQARSKAVFQKVCGVCHTPESAVTVRRTKAQWQESIDKMLSLGAQGTDEEFTIVLNYLVAEYGRDAGSGADAGAPARGAGRGGRGAAPVLRQTGGGAGPDDKHVVDDAAADRGRKVWAAECINCHGTYARGTDNGPNLIRSELVLHDRYGSQIGPFLKKGHPMQSGALSAGLSPVQVSELSHFIHQRVYDTLRGSPIFQVHDVVTGDAEAGAAYFNGEGKCATCHSPSGDLAGIGSKYDPATLQGRFLSPRPLGGRGGRGGRGGPPAASAGKQMTLTVTPPSGQPVTGVPVVFDDFDVVVRDASGDLHSWTRTPALEVVRNDPYAAHDELLERYTDKNMHDIVAYLVTLK